MFKNFLTIILLVSLVIGAPVEPTKPSEDDFYKPPDGFEDAEPGTILKMRNTPFRISSVYFPVNIANSWQMLVRTQDALGNASTVVSTIFEPFNANRSRLLSYQIAEDAANIDCSPSYSFMGGGGIGTLEAKLEMFYIQTALDQGYYVVSPDYEGPISGFTVGKLSGYSTLDSIKAALKTTNATNIKSDADVVLWGYSGGTIASGWAAGLQPHYAEELTPNLKGAALGGWVTNITATAEIIEGTIFAGLTANAIAGLTHQYPELKQFVHHAIDSDRLSKFDDASNICLINSIFEFAYTDYFSGPNRYTQLGWDIFDDEIVKTVINENTLGIEENEDIKPEIPIFVYHGVLDEIVPYKDSIRVYDVWCDGGDGMNSFEFASSNSTGHILEFIEGLGAALKWIQDRFEGKPPVDGCQMTSRTTNVLYPGALTQYYDFAKALGDNILGTKIGPIDSETILEGLKKQNVDVEKLKKRNTFM